MPNGIKKEATVGVISADLVVDQELPCPFERGARKAVGGLASVTLRSDRIELTHGGKCDS